MCFTLYSLYSVRDPLCFTLYSLYSVRDPLCFTLYSLYSVRDLFEEQYVRVLECDVIKKKGKKFKKIQKVSFDPPSILVNE